MSTKSVPKITAPKGLASILVDELHVAALWIAYNGNYAVRQGDSPMIPANKQIYQYDHTPNKPKQIRDE